MIDAVREAEAAQWSAPEELRDLQCRRLSALIKFAAEKVPFYRDRFRAAGVRPEDVRTPEDLERLPLLTREDLEQADRNGLLPSGVPLRSSRTSGTSGRFLTVYQSPEYGARAVFPLWRRALRAGGLKTGERYLRITHPERFEYPTLLRAVDCDVTAPLSELIGSLTAHRAQALLVHPSTLQFLCLEYSARGLPPPEELRRLFTVGDTLTAATRRQAEQVFGCAPIDQYSAIELPAGIAWQCELREGYHVNADALLLELVDEQGRRVPPGAPGQVVLTDFLSEPVPLIRYRLADEAVWSEKPCACGRGLPCLERISGRLLERMRLSSGEWLTPHHLDEVLAPLEQILQYQVRQLKPDRVLVRLVLAAGCNPAEILERTERRLRRTSLGSVELELERVDRIEVDRNREYRLLVPLK